MTAQRALCTALRTALDPDLEEAQGPAPEAVEIPVGSPGLSAEPSVLHAKSKQREIKGLVDLIAAGSCERRWGFRCVDKCTWGFLLVVGGR